MDNIDLCWIGSINFNNFDGAGCDVEINLLLEDQIDILVNFSMDQNWGFEKQFYYGNKLYRIEFGHKLYEQKDIDQINVFIEKNWEYFEQIIMSGLNSMRLFRNRNG